MTSRTPLPLSLGTQWPWNRLSVVSSHSSRRSTPFYSRSASRASTSSFMCRGTWRHQVILKGENDTPFLKPSVLPLPSYHCSRNHLACRDNTPIAPVVSRLPTPPSALAAFPWQGRWSTGGASDTHKMPKNPSNFDPHNWDHSILIMTFCRPFDAHK